MRKPQLVVVVVGVLLALSVFIGDLVYGVDPGLTVVFLVVLGGVALAAKVGRTWSYVLATTLLAAAAFIMFQLSFGGPSGEEVTQLAERLSGPISWALFGVACVGVLAGIAAISNVRGTSRATLGGTEPTN